MDFSSIAYVCAHVGEQILSDGMTTNIIQKVDGKFEDPETKIIIFPSILFAVTNEKITALSQTISILEEKEIISHE